MSARSFTIASSEIGVEGGRYMGSSPYTAAAKAARALYKEKKAGKKTAIRFTVRETTRGEDGKTFEYIGMKEQLDQPKEIKRGDTTITVTHVYRVKSCGK